MSEISLLFPNPHVMLSMKKGAFVYAYEQE